MHSKLHIQSAMEYLMTYGWAILIIAVVLGALFQLGIFNLSTFAPKATPGSCQIIRPDGPSTTRFINMEGACSGELPQYVAKFDGHTTYVDMGNPTVLNLAGSTFTITAWINPSYPVNPYGSYGQIVARTDSGGNGGYEFGWYGSTRCSTTYVTNGLTTIYSSDNVCAGSWAFVALTSSITSAIFYVNGKQSNSGAIIFPSSTQNTGIGKAPGRTSPVLNFNGMISNVQIYNSSLSSNEITTLYNEGIGGAPVQLNNITAWWPLNGDVKDYSGNGNSGTPSSITFTSSWASNYYAP